MKSKLLAAASVGTIIGCFTPLPVVADSLQLSVNGTCEVGGCSGLTALAPNASESLTFSFDVTLSNGDTFALAGTMSANNGTRYNPLPSTSQIYYAQYLGNNGNAVVSQPDSLAISATTLFDTNSLVGTNPLAVTAEGITGSFQAGVGYGSSVSLTLTALDGIAIPVGPFNSNDSPNFGGGGSSTEDFASATQWNEDFSLTFGQGSAVGSCIVINDTTSCPTAPAPGPIAGAGLPGLALGGGGLFVGWWRRRRKPEASI